MRTVLLFAGISTLLSGCAGADYEIKDNKVYYSGWNEGNGSYRRLIEKADASTFEKIPTDDNLILGKDKKHVFLQEEIIGTNPETFKRIGEYFFVDKTSVYFFGFSHGNRTKWSLDSVDVNTFKLYPVYPWGRDKTHLIYGDLLVETTDLKNFKPINEYWGKTDKLMINEGIVIDSVDMKSFEIIDDNRAKDCNYKYEYGKRVKK